MHRVYSDHPSPSLDCDTDSDDGNDELDGDYEESSLPTGPTIVGQRLVDRVVDEFDKKLRDAMQSAPPMAPPVAPPSVGRYGHSQARGPIPEEVTRPKSHIVGLARSGQNSFDIGGALADVHLNIGLLQLLDAAPRLRTELSKLVAAEKHGSGKKTTPDPMLKNLGFLTHPSHGVDQRGDTFVIRGRGIGRDEVGVVSSCHVRGYGQVLSDRFMIDSSATLECVSPQFCEKMGVVPSTLEIPWKVTLANDSTDSLTKYVIINLVVGGASTAVVAFVYGNGSFDVMLSNSWLMRVRAIQDWGTQTITIHTRDGSPETIPFTIIREPDCDRIVGIEPTATTPVSEDRMREVLAFLKSAPTDIRLAVLGKVITQS